MHPDIAAALAQSHLADLHREAAHRRSGRQRVRRRTGRASWGRRGAAGSAITAWRTGRATVPPACCPA